MREAKTLSLGTTADLVVTCPWKPGIIQADEPILPRTRLAITFRTIFGLRKVGREARESVFADPIERLEQIHSFRLAAAQDGLRLSVTYDFGWEAYMRALHDKGGPFLDLLCCHCKDYKLARDTPLDEWQGWIRSNQLQSDYFYSATSLTVGDLAALSQAERLQRDEADLARGDRQLTGFCSRSAEDLAEIRRGRGVREAQAQAIGVIGAMYRLTRYWTADVSVGASTRDDAITLIRATRAMIEGGFTEPGAFALPIEQMYRAELAWYRQPIAESKSPRRPLAGHKPADVQRGVLTGFDRPGAPITHGAAVFLGVTDAIKARKALSALSLASEAGESPADGVYTNLAFTYGGLERLSVDPAVLRTAPEAFREGAAARAPSLGDVRGFHPANWRPLTRNWSPRPEWEVELERVDVLVLLRAATPDAPTDIGDEAHPLRTKIGSLEKLPGLELLAVEGLNPASAPGSNIDHLGFRDGLSQPTLTGEASRPWSDKVEEGALLVGRGERKTDPFWLDGSFLAVRRMTIDRAKFESVVNADCRPGVKDPELLAAKLVGRRRDGTRIGAGRAGNNFVFDGDETGALCPLDSHIRRANPRLPDTPRIMRRGMSFGPPASAGGAGAASVVRGNFFMAYCADLADQYERVLTWVNGGNSTRTGSYLADPLLGAPETRGRTFRFLHEGAAQRLGLPGPEGAPIGLSWSLYLFTPSIKTIQALKNGRAGTPPADDLVERGKAIIATLQATGAGPDAWRAALSDPGARELGSSQAIWAAIRANGGQLESPVGYLVGGYDLVLDLLRDDGGRFTNRGAGARVEQAINGRFHLGLDPIDPDYARLSEPTNSALRSVSEEASFKGARAAAAACIDKMLATAKALGEPVATVDLLTGLIEPVFAILAKGWYGIPDEKHVVTGVHGWMVPENAPPSYPGNFWHGSRHAFNPFLSAETQRLAVREGEAIVNAITAFVAAGPRDKLAAPVTKQIAAGTQSYPQDEDLARTLVGSLIGGVPTVAGNAARILIDLLQSGALDRAQFSWRAMPDAERSYEEACKRFGPLIAVRFAHAPVPELLWRQVANEGVVLGGKALEKDRIVIFSLESAAHERLSRGIADTYIPYGMAPPETPPTSHGCPGRDMANGILLGLVVGLLETARFRPGAAPGMALLRPLA